MMIIYIKDLVLNENCVKSEVSPPGRTERLSGQESWKPCLLSQATSLLSPSLTQCLTRQEKQKRRREAGPSHPGEKCAQRPQASLVPGAAPEEVGESDGSGRGVSLNSGRWPVESLASAGPGCAQ